MAHEATSSISTAPGWDASPSQGYSQHQIRRYPFIHLGGERHCRGNCLAQEHNTMSPASDRTRTARTAPPLLNRESLTFLPGIHIYMYDSTVIFALSREYLIVALKIV